jgi:hypothetical protein
MPPQQPGGLLDVGDNGFDFGAHARSALPLGLYGSARLHLAMRAVGRNPGRWICDIAGLSL